MEFRVLAIGDVTSEEGTAHLRRHLPGFKKMKGVDFTVINGENISGTGLTPQQADDLFAAGADVITLGNHEFDYGFPQLMENLKKHQGDFMVACNNLVDDEGELIFAPGGTAPIYADDTYETELFRIAIVGMATPETQTKANPALMKGLSFIGGKDLYKVTQEDVDMARSEGNADIVIALGHLGVDKSSEPNCSYNVMQNVKGIDLFIDGHSHTVMTASKDNNMVQSTGTGLAYVGAIVIDNATKSIESNGLIDLSAYTKEDATVKAAADKIISDINAEYGKVFARTDVELNGAKEPGNRTQETNLGDLITDSMLWAIRKDAELTVPAENVVAITNGGGIRAWIHKGDISKLDVNTVLPFGNTVAVVYVTGAELLEALEASTFALPDSLGGFPQIAGMNISIDATKKYDPQTTPYPSGSGKATYYGPASINRVTINSVNGKAFDPNKTYAVVTNNFCAAGGDTYYAFAAASSQFDTGLPLDEVLMDYIKAVRTIRNDMNVHPAKKTSMTIETANPAAFQKGGAYLARFAFATDVALTEKYTGTTDGVVTVVTPAARGFIPMMELIDREKELKRLHKELEKAEKEANMFRNQLNNPKFVERAPAALVEEIRAKFAKSQDKLANIEQSIKALG